MPRPSPRALPDTVTRSDAPSARELLLKLLVSRKNQPLDAATAIRACALFDVADNAVRVALNRLLASGLVETAGRGAYRLGPQGRAMGREVAAWRDLEQQLVPWDGGWVAVLALASPDRKVQRANQRALALLGLRELTAGLCVRPDNLDGGVMRLRKRLRDLGLDRGAPVFQVRELDTPLDKAARGLWPLQALAAAYDQTQAHLQASLTRLPQLPLEAAAREAWLTGDAAIRQLVFDPLLPEPLVPAPARAAFLDTVKAYDDAGKRIWRRFLA
ncbi:PaaX family transcriptional regulator [Comamonas serinivorans]|uniref:PaaX family transcriptional regulator n=1 Tax=Comamonas serinivorans TaxID=1082851 RepID=A0A1Y0ELW9_9BURK|nr:PaaX family transcriptional regulator C-terminal domain-containing protein [Comamonas serinivorans]ARU04441.1 PaaX family transcriptional regulator [Comamonas serinivorans]